MNDDEEISLEQLLQLNVAVPRYTSYPTANLWDKKDPSLYYERLKALKEKQAPLSLYLHVPFCKTMCLYCACSVILNRRADKQKRYVDYLNKEIRLLAKVLDYKPLITQIHFGGGTPTALDLQQFQSIFLTLEQNFTLDYDQEFSIEIDPRTVIEDEGEKLKGLKELGFNRVSFGIQDSNEEVQQAVKRHQSWEMSEVTFHRARKLGFKEINVDLIYGLPKQSVETFSTTIQQVLGLKPDRISLFSYAKVPWLKPHQKAIKEADLPSTSEKFSIYLLARKCFQQAGYVAIGMDHFALEGSPLVEGYRQKKLQRNFQGYFLKASPDLIGLGVTAIGEVGGHYFQNEKDLESYHQILDNNQLPVGRIRMLNEDDKKRKWVIASLMCRFEVEFAAFEELFQESFESYFVSSLSLLEPFEVQGMLQFTPEKLVVLKKGELFIRNISSCFDAYYQKTSRAFSKAI